nr:HpaA family protein [Helicobacter heilmannii]
MALLDPHIQVSGNLQPYLDQFQDALAKQIQDIFQRMGYQVVHATNAKALTPEQKHKIWSVLDIGGWVGILEDIKMNTDNPKSTNMDVMVDQSSGSVWFKLYEPENRAHCPQLWSRSGDGTSHHQNLHLPNHRLGRFSRKRGNKPR